MTAAYMKEQVTAHYYGDSGQSARVYTIVVDVDECDAPALAYACLLYTSNLTAVSSSIMSEVRYAVGNMTGAQVRAVDVYVDSMEID